jgi:hypothetical protein
MIALQVPDLIHGIDDIEQIFQRLNRQGTPLDNEELAYSLIKAYWTDVDETIRKLPHHTTEARLVCEILSIYYSDAPFKNKQAFLSGLLIIWVLATYLIDYLIIKPYQLLIRPFVRGKLPNQLLY